MFSLRFKVFILCVLFAAAEEDSNEEDLKFGKIIFVLLGYTICILLSLNLTFFLGHYSAYFITNAHSPRTSNNDEE